MMALVPVVGEPLQRLVVGGSEYGHHTLTRFFALHAGVLPGLLADISGDARRPVPPARSDGPRAEPAAGHHVLARTGAARRGARAWP